MFFKGAVAMELGPGAQTETSSGSALFCAAGLKFRAHENITTFFGCRRLPSGAPDTLTHPMSATQFRGLWLLERSYSCPQAKSRGSAGVVLVSVCAFRTSANFDDCSTTKSMCRPPLRKCGRPIWRESQADVGETLS